MTTSFLVTLKGFIKAYWHWFLVVGFALVWWVIHVLRVETLVRRRTAELTREIQERAKAEAEAERHRQERNQFSRLGLLGEVASNIAHELNQPLAAISNYAEGMTTTSVTSSAFLGPALSQSHAPP